MRLAPDVGEEVPRQGGPLGVERIPQPRQGVPEPSGTGSDSARASAPPHPASTPVTPVAPRPRPAFSRARPTNSFAAVFMPPWRSGGHGTLP